MASLGIIPVDQNGFIDFSGWTLDEVCNVAPQYGPDGRSNFVLDECSGALVVRPERRAKVVAALLDRASHIANSLDAT